MTDDTARATPCDDEQLKAAFLKGVESAHEARLARPSGLLREAIQRALNELGVPDENYPAPVASAVEILRAALAAAEPGLDVERLTDAMYEAGRKGLIYDGITNKDEAAIYAAEYARLSGREP